MLQVANELWERLGNIGWSVVELVHDPDRHPCEVVAEVSSADVLLTTHGFQVNFENILYHNIFVALFMALVCFNLCIELDWIGLGRRFVNLDSSFGGSTRCSS